MGHITLHDLLTQWKIIIASAIICALVAFIIAAMLPAKYQSDISMIVIQKQSTEKVDAFSATKSAEFLSNVFTKVVFTTSFFNAVQDAPFDVEREFSRDPEKRQKEWNKMIKVKKVNNTSIINISVLNESRKTAEETAKAIAYIYKTNSEEYHGGGEQVEVRLIDGPNTPLKPTVPHIGLSTGIGALVGLLGAVLYILMIGVKKNRMAGSCAIGADTMIDDIDEEVQAFMPIQVIATQEEKIEMVEDHFRGVQGEIEYDDEVTELHERISNFSKNFQK